MARDGVFFDRVGRLDPRTRVPVLAIALQGAAAAVIALSGRYEQILNYVVSVDFIAMGLTGAALFVYRRRGEAGALPGARPPVDDRLLRAVVLARRGRHDPPLPEGQRDRPGHPRPRPARLPPVEAARIRGTRMGRVPRNPQPRRRPQSGVTWTRPFSEYMEWAKTRSAARFNLASSGVVAFPLAELGARIEDLEICGDERLRLRAAAGAPGAQGRRRPRPRRARDRHLDGEPARPRRRGRARRRRADRGADLLAARGRGALAAPRRAALPAARGGGLPARPPRGREGALARARASSS